MTALQLTLAHGVAPVPERASLLPALDVEFLAVDQKRNERALARLEFDAAEVSFSYYLLAREQGTPLIALPVFPYRTFWHRFFFCHERAPLHTLTDLKTRTVAIPRLSNTLVIWTLGDMDRLYGVPVREIHWVTLEDEGYGWSVPKGWKVKRAPVGKEIGEMLEEGVIDAALAPRPLDAISRGRYQVRRLLGDWEEKERDYFRVSAIFPILHTFVLKERVWKENPWVAEALCKKLSGCRSRDSMDLQTVDSPWPQVIKTFLECAFRLGLSRRLWSIEELFVPIQD